MEENNLLPVQTKTNDDNEEALAGAATALSPLSPSTYNSASKNHSQSLIQIKIATAITNIAAYD